VLLRPPMRGRTAHVPKGVVGARAWWLACAVLLCSSCYLSHSVPLAVSDAMALDAGVVLIDAADADASPVCGPPRYDVVECPGTGPVNRGEPGDCNTGGMHYCSYLLGNETSCGGVWSLRATCIDPVPPAHSGTCVRASLCVGTDLSTCRCGDEAACPEGQICAANTPDTAPHCACL